MTFGTPTRRRRSRSAITVSVPVVVAVLLAGCGSTALDRSAAGQAVGDGSGLSTGGLGVGSPDGRGQELDGPPVGDGQQGQLAAGVAAEDAPSAGSALAGSGSAGAGAGSSAVGPRSAGGPPNASGRGFTAKEVYIGVGAADGDSETVISSLGVKGLGDFGDTRAQTQAVVDDINERGGLMGRKIVLVWHAFNTSEVLFDPNTAAQKACADWTEDRPVFAVASSAVNNDVFLSCLNKHQVPFISATGVQDDSSYQTWYDRYPLYFNVGGMQGERFNRLSIERLMARKYFTGWDTVNGQPGSAPVKVGILVVDDHGGQAELTSLTRELARFGMKPAYVFRYSADLATNQPQQSNAVLRFQTERITHVFGAGATFMSNAESQNYRPRYFIPTLAALYAATVPASQLEGSMGEGFLPAQDVSAADYPGHPSPASAYCFTVMKEAGQTPTDQTTVWAMQIVCDSFYPLKAAIDASATLTPTGVRAGFESMQWKAQSALTWKTFFGPGEHLSARAVRDLAYRASTQSYYYSSAQNWVG